MLHKRRHILYCAGGFLLGCLLGPHVARAQQGFGIEANLLAGKVFKHEAKFTLPIPALTLGGDLNFVWRTYGSKEWQQRRHYPRLGIAVAAVHYGINEVYGTTYGLYPNITFPLAVGHRLEWTARIGNGIGYATGKYSRAGTINTVNVAVSSTINDFIMIRTDAAWGINKHWGISAGAFVTHISNGSVRKPNLGVNVAGLGAGVSYYPITSRPAILHRQLSPLPGRWLLQLRYSMSLISAYGAGGPLYPVYIGTGYASRRWRSHNKAFAGLDYAWYSSTRAFLRNNGLEPGREAASAYKAAIIAGNEFMLGRVGILVQAGAYVKHSYLRKEDVYQKAGISYYCVQHEHGPIKELFFFMGLKAHLNVAEMGELGIGVGL